MSESAERPITLLIAALGGEGGGVQISPQVDAEDLGRESVGQRFGRQGHGFHPLAPFRRCRPSKYPGFRRLFKPSRAGMALPAPPPAPL